MSLRILGNQALDAFLGAPVGAARRLTGGASRETWAIDAGAARLVLRADLGGEILEGALSRADEFAVLQAAHGAGVRVPRPIALGADASVLGVPFFVMERLEGESVGRRIVREPALEESRRRLPAQMGEQLARIHALPPLAFLPRPDAGQSPALFALAQASSQLARAAEPHPVLAYALRWLRARTPASPTVLVHGDFRIGNMMVGAEGLAGVFDWEFCHLGDPHEDLAWPCVKAWRFREDAKRFGGVGDPEEFFAAYERLSGRTVDRSAVRFWEVVGNLRWAVGCIAQADRHLSGAAPSVELASLGRRTCEMERELLDLIEATP
ncbi:MAG: phosphotransferase family protein [Gemmataceae bacterium]|nr:phosphotransferase family protein [Gemmataceae bacterium]